MRALLLCAVALGACCSPPAVPEDSGSPMPDAGPLEWPVLSLGTTIDPADPTRIGADAMPADLSCLGVMIRPEPGDPVPLEVRVIEFFTNATVADVCVRGYPSGDPPDPFRRALEQENDRDTALGASRAVMVESITARTARTASSSSRPGAMSLPPA